MDDRGGHVRGNSEMKGERMNISVQISYFL